MRGLEARLERLAATQPQAPNGCVLIYPAGQRPDAVPPGIVFLMPDNGRDNLEAAHARAATSA